MPNAISHCDNECIDMKEGDKNIHSSCNGKCVHEWTRLVIILIQPIFSCFTGFLMGWICVPHQLDSSSCFGSDDNWQVFTQNLCCILRSKLKKLNCIQAYCWKCENYFLIHLIDITLCQCKVIMIISGKIQTVYNSQLLTLLISIRKKASVDTGKNRLRLV